MKQFGVRTIIVARAGDALPIGCTHFDQLLAAGGISLDRSELVRRKPGANDERRITLRCVTEPDEAQAMLLKRLGLTLPRRLRRLDQPLPM